MTRPAAPELQVRKWSAGRWTDSPDAVVTEEPLQLMLEGKPLSVVMRTPGNDLELCLGLMFAEGILRTLQEVSLVHISAEAGDPHVGSRRDTELGEAKPVGVRCLGVSLGGRRRWS